MSLHDPVYTLVQDQPNGPHYLHRNGKGLLCPHFSPSKTELRIAQELDGNQVQHRVHGPLGCGTHCALFHVYPKEGNGAHHIDQRCATTKVQTLCEVVNAKAV